MQRIVTYENLKEVNKTIKTTDIKGKKYAEVNQRIKAFRMLYPEGVIKTEMLQNENGVCVFIAKVYTDEQRLLATGTAYEKENSSFINKTSYIENCETSAIGRALGIAGFGIDTSLASADEVRNTIQNQEVTQEEADNYKLTFGKYKNKTLKEIQKEDNEYIEWLLGNSKDERMIKLIELATGIKKMPEVELQEKLNLINELNILLDTQNVDREKLYKHYKVKTNKDLTIAQLKDAIERLKERG